MKKVAIIISDSNGGYPVPAVNGGAVPTLVEHLVAENSEKGIIHFSVFTPFDKGASEKASSYKNVDFRWIKIPFLIKVLDRILFNFIKFFFKKKKSISFKTLFSLLFSIIKISLCLKKETFDCVIIENNIPLAWSLKLSKYKGIFYYHFHNLPRISANCKDVFKNCKGFLCVSKFVANEIGSEKSAIGKAPQNKQLVLYNCIDTDLFRKNETQRDIIRKRFRIKDDEKVIIFVGRLSEEKGIDYVLDSLNHIQTPKVKILIVGSLMFNSKAVDVYTEKLYRLAKQWENKVVFTGYIPQKDLPSVYSAADIAVLPSIWNEPAGLTMLEAMACELPLITTSVGGIPEYVQDKAIVLKVNHLLSRNIADSVDFLFSDLKRMVYMAKEGRDHVVMNFSKKIYLENFYKKLND